jgi:hypothetical protein
MIMIYSNAAFDDLAELTPRDKLSKGKAFVYHTEKILGAAEGSLSKIMMSAFKE